MTHGYRGGLYPEIREGSNAGRSGRRVGQRVTHCHSRAAIFVKS